MRILHIGQSLPDARVEKTMVSDIKRGANVAFIGYFTGKPAFDQLSEIITFQFDFGFWDQIGMRSNTLATLKQVVNSFDPDLIHAHDIYNAGLAMKIDCPFIYNDHEGWSEKIKYTTPSGSIFSKSYWRRKIGLQLRSMWIKKNEPKILKDRVTITVSPELAHVHQLFGANSFVMHNFPMKSEADLPKLKEKEQGSVAYVGKDMSTSSNPFRDTTGFLDVMKQTPYHFVVIGDDELQSHDNITSIGFVPHQEINQLLLPYQFGSLAFQPHPFHKFADHVKSYHYLFAGMMIIAPSTFHLDHIPFVRYYDDMTDIPKLLSEKNLQSPDYIQQYSYDHYIWEHEEQNLLDAVRLALD